MLGGISISLGDCGIQSWEIVGQFIELMGTAAAMDVAWRKPGKCHADEIHGSRLKGRGSGV